MDAEIKELLEDIQSWMLDNDCECGEQGSELYSRISKALGRNDDE